MALTFFSLKLSADSFRELQESIVCTTHNTHLFFWEVIIHGMIVAFCVSNVLCYYNELSEASYIIKKRGFFGSQFWSKVHLAMINNYMHWRLNCTFCICYASTLPMTNIISPSVSHEIVKLPWLGLNLWFLWDYMCVPPLPASLLFISIILISIW